MGHGLPGEPGVPHVLTEAEQHKLDTWDGLVTALEGLLTRAGTMQDITRRTPREFWDARAALKAAKP